MVGNEKGRSESGLFCFHLISSGYQAGGIGLPNFLGGFGGEVVWNQRELLRCGGVGVDSFWGAVGSGDAAGRATAAHGLFCAAGAGRDGANGDGSLQMEAVGVAQ